MSALRRQGKTHVLVDLSGRNIHILDERHQERCLFGSDAEFIGVVVRCHCDWIPDATESFPIITRSLVLTGDRCMIPMRTHVETNVEITMEREGDAR